MDYSKITKTNYKVFSIALNVFTFDENFKRIRNKFRDKCSECHVCNSQFKDGEKISLAATDKGNKVICNKCAIELSTKNSQIKVIDKVVEK